jgi:integrase
VAMVEALKNPKLILEIRTREWWRVFLYIAYYLGLRRGEILGLIWEQVRMALSCARSAFGL